MTDDFFEEQRQQSKVKTAIVTKYFAAWSRVMKPRNEKLGYIDLFAGPGIYEDGAKSTPIIILETILQDPLLASKMLTYFNDRDPGNIKSLQAHAEALSGFQTLRFKPAFKNYEVGSEITSQLASMPNMIPTILFVDPFGYKGVTLDLLGSVLRHRGCEIILFFNYRRINAAIDNSVFKDHMVALFGEERVVGLQEQLALLSPAEREMLIVEQISQALMERGAKYVLPFRFKGETGSRTNHHLIFASKNVLGYKIMKDIMAAESSGKNGGVADFEYNPATEKYPILFSLTPGLDSLRGMLLKEFAGRSATRDEIFKTHHIGKPFVEKNYREVLLKLEEDGIIATIPKIGEQKRRKGTMGENVMITFP